jgi:hypothetical protein
MSLEDLSKLWMIFQTGYRISATYQVSLVLIDSRRSTRAPLPVLTRGQDDSGVIAQSDLVPPFPALLSIVLPNKQSSARVDDRVSLGGVHLDGDSVAVRFTTMRLTSPELETEVDVTVPDIPAGSYTVAVQVSKAGQPDHFTNEFPLQIAPQIISITPATAPAGAALTLTLKCKPDVLPAQRASLLFGDREVLADPHPATQLNPTIDTLTFRLTELVAGDYFVRLRVDGVDSLLIIQTGVPPKLQFDPNQKVTIT